MGYNRVKRWFLWPLGRQPQSAIHFPFTTFRPCPLKACGFRAGSISLVIIRPRPGAVRWWSCHIRNPRPQMHLTYRMQNSVTKRGGWVQMAEIYFNVQSDNGSITDRHALREWSRRYMRALEDLKDLRVAPRLAGLMTAAGLQEVDMRMIQLPLSAWSSGKLLP